MVKNRFNGVLFGQAIGDALGLGTEFMTLQEVRKNYPEGLHDYSQIIQDSHRRRWKRSEWTDDTDMMLCIANAIIADKGVNLTTVASNFKEWFNHDPMGIGGHTYKVLAFTDYVLYPQKVANAVWELSRGRAAANGGIMRTSVVGLLRDDVERYACEICGLTHSDSRCLGSCVILSMLINSFVYKNHELTPSDIISLAHKYDPRTIEYINLAQCDDLEALKLDDSEMGYTLKTLSAALWALWHVDSFEEGLLAVINAGGDADTNGAVVGSLLGAKYGFNSIPVKYIDGLLKRDYMRSVADRLFDVINS